MARFVVYFYVLLRREISEANICTLICFPLLPLWGLLGTLCAIGLVIAMKLVIQRSVGPNECLSLRYVVQAQATHDELVEWLASQGAKQIGDSTTWEVLGTFVEVTGEAGGYEITLSTGQYPTVEYAAFLERESQKIVEDLAIANAINQKAFGGKVIAKREGSYDVPLAYVSARKIASSVLVQATKIVRDGPIDGHFESVDPFVVEAPAGKTVWGSVVIEIARRFDELACSDEHLTIEWDSQLPLE